MLEYDTFCYLENQKTGSTFVITFLNEFSAEPLRNHKKHAAVEVRDPDKFYFINVREPLASYRSLFAFGLEGNGTVFARFDQLGYGHLYKNGAQGFSEWLRFVLDRRNAQALAGGYTLQQASAMGLMTWRFMRLAIFRFEQLGMGNPTMPAIRQHVQQHFFMNAVIRQESLRRSLAVLVRGPLASRLTDPQAAIQWLKAAPRINASTARVSDEEAPLDEPTLSLLFQKERYMYANFYPDAPGYADWKARKTTGAKVAP